MRLSTLTSWLRGEGRGPDEGRRVWVQQSLTTGLFLACLEEGPHGHGKTTFWGKAPTPFGAMQAALDAWAGEQEGGGR